MTNVPMTTRPHPGTHFFSGNHAPLGEERDLAALDVVGPLPPGLSGSLYRVGPNPRHAPRDPGYHWFAGDGMVHAFHIRGGAVAYRNRWARTPRWQLEDEAGRALFGMFGNPAATDPLALGRNAGTANTQMLWHAERLFALEEGHQPFELDPRTLASRGHQDFDGGIPSRCTAHPKVDPETGELHFFAYAPDAPCSRTLSYGVMDARGRVTHQRAFEAPHASMVHDFMLTRRHALFPVTPLTFDMDRARLGKPLLAWDAGRRTHVGVLPRGDVRGAVRWFETDPCHVFHVMNAWEDGDTLVAHVMQSDAAPGLPLADGPPGDPGATAARLWRWTFDLGRAGNGFERECLDDLVAEFPRIDERFTGRRHRFRYATAHATARPRGDDESALFDSLVRYDLGAGTRTLFTLPAGDVVSEPVFVPRAADAPEGDGWLLAVAWRAQEARSDLLVLDAADLASGPLALARLPHRVPFGFHGTWRPDAPRGAATP